MLFDCPPNGLAPYRIRKERIHDRIGGARFEVMGDNWHVTSDDVGGRIFTSFDHAVAFVVGSLELARMEMEL